MIKTPNSNRIHIAVFGRRNAGKSTLINALTSQNTSLVSEVKGTTTDPVYKAIEFHPIGPVVFIDTAGIDDEGTIGKLRVEKAKEILFKTDIAILLFDDENLENFQIEEHWYNLLRDKNIPVVGVINRKNVNSTTKHSLKNIFNIKIIELNAVTKENLEQLKDELVKIACEIEDEVFILGDIIGPKSKVLLVAPQDIQAPKGRLILPQVQTLRDILDHHGIPMIVTLEEVEEALKILDNKPDLVVVDSQVFKKVNELIPKNIPLTSFSILMARQKGDLKALIDGAKTIDKLKNGDKVLICEACSHHSLKGDIAREKIPKLLKDKVNEIVIHNVNGNDFPKNLSEYKLVIHCGSCMFNRRQFMARIDYCNNSNVAITNFGLAIAKLNNMLDRVIEPFKL
ncbi:MAG: [FeFe] hydrogenase H-cluster maturation GTPase HydF [Clostridium argentinense]|uniref:[FeFe] hydrogenase H-cluster maturation GTPase HydF n=1 Tax=Clostridium faecium TaxID=2762223 RepID=A0ABR8YN89_9CLOT|nr:MULTISPECIES: [FeFe] hydrogenase H-cluster maturation GTPase HydF [Clostridium]MBD8045715.1 [FeFe] hydrogenase H-cluster maturation GTPase HydF [Clostridium faecium]MBS5823980.1 [FeFe] hydrogenase H-cluster maturation GTPase HydF [Clostridium argentinense]MDU1348866.1 [FeFe] hydrogenase H-cluster maturation GTPase HydF [Clostridium argentinense]